MRLVANKSQPTRARKLMLKEATRSLWNLQSMGIKIKAPHSWINDEWVDEWANAKRKTGAQRYLQEFMKFKRQKHCVSPLTTSDV